MDKGKGYVLLLINAGVRSSVSERKKSRRLLHCIQEGDLVILKDGDQHRNIWPLGLIEHVFPSDDNLVRKLLLRTIIDGQPRVYVRPITQTVQNIELENYNLTYILVCHKLMKRLQLDLNFTLAQWHCGTQ
jgi:hypothetical protein